MSLPPSGINLGPRPNLTPQQLQTLQQLQRANNGQPITPQQMQQAVAAFQAQGGNVNPQALLAAMRGMTRPPMSSQPGQQGQPGQPGQIPPNPAQVQAMMAQQQQQRIQMLQQGMSHQQIQAVQGKMNPGVGGIPGGMTGSPSRPPSHTQQMLPPAVPPGTSPRPQQTQQRFYPTPQQQAQLAHAQSAAMSSPQFQSLPESQRQAYLYSMQQNMLRTFAMQQQQHQQQQQLGVMGPPTGQSNQTHQGQPAVGTQQSPSSQQRDLSGSQQGQPSLSGLPQHMAPPRPESRTAQRDASPHGRTGSPSGHHTPTPPPPGYQQQHQQQGMSSAPSPVPSAHSHHSQTRAPTPQSTALSHHGQSPMPTQTTDPSPTAPQQNSQRAPSVPPGGQTPHQSSIQNMPPGMPSQSNLHAMLPQGMQNLTPQQQQQVLNAMSLMSQSAQSQLQSQPQSSFATTVPGGLPQQPRPGIRPPLQMPNINTSDFPFDWRLIPHLSSVSDPKWRAEMQARNPGLLHAAMSAQQMMSTGSVRPDTLNRMQQVFVHMARAQGLVRNTAGPSGPGVPGLPGAIGGMGVQGMPGFSGVPGVRSIGNVPNVDNTGQGIPPQLQQLQQQLSGQWRPPLPGQIQTSGSSQTAQISPMRPPPHLPPPHTIPQGTPVQQRMSEGKDRKSGSQMPPPQWIPSHGQPIPGQPGVPMSAGSMGMGVPATPTPLRPPPHTAPDHVSPSPALPPPTPHAVPVREWETALPLDLPITNIAPLPTEEIDERSDPTFDGRLLSLTEKEKENVRDWVESDKEYAKVMKSYKETSRERVMRWAERKEQEKGWWIRKNQEGPPTRRERLSILWPQDKASMRAKSTHRGRREIRFTPAQLKAMAEVEDHVVPIRLDIEHESHRLKDTFMWNCSDTVVTPELFAQTLCDDFHLPLQHFHHRIVTAIQERVKEYQDQILPIIPPSLSSQGQLHPEDEIIWERFRGVRESTYSDEQTVKTPSGDGDEMVVIVGGSDQDESSDKEIGTKEEPMSVEEAMAGLPEDQADELRILVKVDIIVGTQNLSDTFEWDLNSSVTPEEFASSHCSELGLSGEFATALAHDIHEQCLTHLRSLFLIGHTPGSGLIQDEEVRSFFLPSLVPSSLLRKEDIAMSTYTPIFATFTEEDVAAIEKERDRESKRKKRGTRARRGIILPDREPLKTHRTLLNPLRSHGNAPLPNMKPETPTTAPPTSRRAAAIAAQASINLLAQDLPLPQPPSPIPQPQTRRPKRGAREQSRASPMSARENSVMDDESLIRRVTTNHLDIMENEDINGMKRKADFEDEINNNKMLKIEHFEKSWHCKNCGIPEHLTNALGSDQQGNKTLCSTCSQYFQRTGRDRPCSYTEEESYHLQKLSSTTPLISNQTLSNQNVSSSSTSIQVVKPISKGSIQEEKEQDGSSSSSDSDDSDDDDFDPRRNKKQTSKTPVRPSVTPSLSGMGKRSSSTHTLGQSTGTGIGNGVQPPDWALKADEELKERYPRDSFVIIQRVKPVGEPELPHEWRMKCMDW
ncbi:hypothetical protein M231_00936 [Tremella mesenterica]|uniref:GATA-type domain-containing protein n=1 Tax=Tremella mesenterica TaxID=5217 RepID=A0A4Q1BUC3_TREME|nr:hypothetical protein M231_00936 [Tremella mesenterica]